MTAATRERFLTIMTTQLYTQFDAGELQTLHDELKHYMKSGDPDLSQSAYLLLMEMLFYVNVYLSKDIDAEVIYNTLRDRFGENSPKLYVMKATLLQINENDKAAIDFIENLTEERLEYDTDSMSYVLLQKKLLSIMARSHNKEWLLRQLTSLLEKFPLDAEIWWFAGEIYFELGQFERAAFCYEEIICIMPFNYVAFGQLAETLYYKALRVDKSQAKIRSTLQQSLNNALRSVELSEFYLKGWSLIAIISAKLDSKKQLINLARSKLQEISNSSNSKNKATADLILKHI